VPVLSAATLRTQLSAGDPGPLYLLLGEDDSEKAAVAGDFTDLVDPGLQAFNVDRLYGGETTVDALLDAANTFPMMAPRRVVLVVDAERLLIPKRESKAADEELARLEAFIQNPSPHTTVVFVCGSLDMRRRISKTLAREAQVVDCGTIADAADAERWIKARASRDKVPLDAAAVRALVERGGTSLVRLRAGLERVSLYALGQKTISADDVRESVPSGPDQQENFGIADAIRDGDAAAALKQLAAALDNGAAPFFVLGQLRFVAEGIRGPRLREAVGAVFRTDLALKSSGGDQRLLLERLVVELCGEARQGRPGSPMGAQGRWRGAGRR
jgi:DNA polymerase III subunit delta